MRSGIEFHGSEEKYQNKMSATLAASLLSDEEKEILQSFVVEELAGFSTPRKLVSVQHLVTLNRKYGFKDWVSLKDSDFKRVMGNIKQGIIPEEYRYKIVNGEKVLQTVSETYKMDLSLSLRKFCLWLVSKGISHMNESEIRKVKTHHSKTIPRGTESVMSDEDIAKIIRLENNIKYKTYYILVAETAARPSEIASLRKSDFTLIQEEGKSDVFSIKVNQFKGGTSSRNIYIFKNIELVKVYLQTIKDDDGYLFPSNKGGVLKYEAFANRFAKLCKAANVFNHTLYDLRHSKVTKMVMAENKNLIAISKTVWGGNAECSKMLSKYLHPNDSQIMNALRPE